MECPSFIHENKVIPEFYRVVMNYPHSSITDVTLAVNTTLDQMQIEQCGIMPGQSVVIGVGSRNIAHLPLMVKTLCDRIKAIGAVPVIVPAMGSHGGAEATGQIKVLESLGITEKSSGTEIRSSMEVVQVDRILDDVPVFFSRDALAMDHCVVVNRIKPHTKFKGDVESGIYKMLCIGMGKHQGAAALHQAALRHGFHSVIKAAGDSIIRHSNIRFGLGIVENQHDEPLEIKAMLAKDFFSEEARLLKAAKAHFPQLPFKHLDTLIIKNIGKDISGSGMDPNVTGRTYDLMEDDFSVNLSVTRIALLDLSEKSGGNAIGLGNADIITEKLFKKMDYEKTLINALTSTSLRKAFIPVRLDSEESAVKAAFFTTGIKNTDQIRAVIIRDTRNITEFWASTSLLDELAKNPEASIEEKCSLSFSDSGDIVSCLF